MGTLPTLTKTWRFQVNQAAAAGADGTAACQNLMFAIKQSLIGAGAWTDSAGAGAAPAGNWVVDYSCDGVTAGAKGDGTDRWTVATKLVWAAVGVAHSWIVLKQTGIGATFEMLIDCTTGVAVAYISTSIGGFTGGTTLNRPTAPADECILLNTAVWGGRNSATASTVHVFNSTDGACTRVFACRSGQIASFWMIDKPIEPATNWATPNVACVIGDSAAAPTTMTTYGTFSNAPATYGRTTQNYAAYLGQEASNLAGTLGIAQTVANDLGGSWPIYPSYVYSLTPNSREQLGRLADFYWGSTALADSDYFPAAGPQQFVVFGDMIMPWNQTAPTFGGGVSTGRDGEYADVDAFASSAFLQSVLGGPDAATTTTAVNQYLMEAWDSVTGVMYTWPRPTRDYSGTGYPGPNAPLYIAVAAVQPP